MPTFTPPTYSVALAAPPRPGVVGWSAWSIERGQTVYKDGDGVWFTVAEPHQSTLDAAAALPAGDTSESYDGRYVWIGGHTYTVSDAIAAELQAAGYTTS